VVSAGLPKAAQLGQLPAYQAAGVKLTGVGIVSSTAEKYSSKVQQQGHSSAMRRVP
jgi:hypothetical protein